MLPQRKTKGGRTPSAKRKLHSIHGLLRHHSFVGRIELRGSYCDFEFTPTQASLVDNRLVLNGVMGLRVSGSFERFIQPVQARLLGTQGGIGVSPVRRQLLTGTAQTAQTATSEQKLEQEREPETDLQPGLHPFEPPRRDEFGRPIVESTGASGFVGVLYFQLSPLDGLDLASVDASKVQLNARLAATDNTARDLQSLYSDLVLAIHGEERDNKLADSSVEGINRIFKESN
jgi:hypothetical protein